jgi:hypothetical protein
MLPLTAMKIDPDLSYVRQLLDTLWADVHREQRVWHERWSETPRFDTRDEWEHWDARHRASYDDLCRRLEPIRAEIRHVSDVLAAHEAAHSPPIRLAMV